MRKIVEPQDISARNAGSPDIDYVESEFWFRLMARGRVFSTA
jgi:hypothetical protein